MPFPSISIIATILLALALRLPFLAYESGDWTLHFARFVSELETHGLAALSTPLGDTSSAFLYLLAALSLLPAHQLAALKLIYFLFEIGNATLGYLMIREIHPRGRVAVFSFALLLVSPTVILNGSMWGQFDSIYTFFLLLFAYLCMTAERPPHGFPGRPGLAMLSLGFALSFKLQAIFFAIPFLVLLARRFFTPAQIALAPLVFFASLLPACLAGRPLYDLLTIYFRQAMRHQELTVDAASIYLLLPKMPFEPYYLAGISVTAAVALLLTARLLKSKLPFSGAHAVRVCFVSALVIVYLLPGMHERYFYPAEILALVLACSLPGYWPLALLVVVTSLLGYLPYLFGVYVVKRANLAALMGIAAVWATFDLIARCEDSEGGEAAA